MRVNNIFTGKLDEVTPYQKYGEIGKLDRTVGSLKERSDNIEKVLNEDKFFEEYFDEHYDPSISQDSALSEDNNICQMLSSMADYLINSNESKELDKKEETVYVFSEDVEKFKEKRRREKNINDIIDDNVMYVSTPIKPTEFKGNKIDIKKSDFKDSEMADVLNEYQNLINTINEKIKNNGAFARKYNSIKSSVLDDMKMVKESYLGVLPRSKSVPGGHFEKKIPMPDYTDIKVFKRVINTPPAKLEESYELWENSFDFLNLLQKCVSHYYITEEEKDIVILRMYGWEYKEILEDLELKYNSNNPELHLGTNIIRDIHINIKKYLKENENEKTK